MASVQLVLFAFHFLLLLPVKALQNQPHAISLGSSLFPTSHTTSWPSGSGHFAFGFYPHGNGFAVGIWLVSQPQNTIVWTANRDDPPVSSNATLEFTKDGKLLLRTDQGEEKSIANVSALAESASMLDNGNFVLHDSNGSVIWQSFDYPTDTLLGGQSLSNGKALVSSLSSSDHTSGRFSVAMQSDGNLVAYPVNSSKEPEDFYWASNNAYDGDFSIKTLSLNYSGCLSVHALGSIDVILANVSYPTKNRTIIFRATLDPDGIFRLYSHQFKDKTTSNVTTEWVSLQDQCDVKGFCGFNSYCSSTGDKGNCYCYPGFFMANRSEESLACSENLTVGDCRKEQDIHYNMTAVENTWWGDYPYSVSPMTTKEECSRSCKEDCNCGAVLHEGEQCNKYKLPLRYGKRNENMSATAFFKVIMVIMEISEYPVPHPTIVNEGMKSLVTILSISLGSIACLSFVLAFSSFFVYCHRVHYYRKLSEHGSIGLTEECTLQSFSYGELVRATDDFKEELGRGNYGAVYRGTTPGGKTIAVKRLENVVGEGERNFKAEMAAIGQTHHRNLIRLLGFCMEGSRKVLVYEYMSNGSLADVLFKSEMRLVWKERVRIALDVAKGIHYLHEECDVHIIHCNIKPRNILMDDSWTAKISDFGLAKLSVPNQTTIPKGFIGTKGYLAPEWQRNTSLSVKVDIYSFGAVLLEIICCRSSVEINVEDVEEILLPSWVYNCFAAGELEKLVKGENVDLQTLERMVKIGLWCIQDDPDLRPSMKIVILMLEGIMDVPVPPSPSLSCAI